MKRDKVLIVIQDGPSNQDARPVTVKASTTDLFFVVVDHRQNAPRRVDSGTCDKVATVQDFSEAVFDETADYVQYNRQLIEEAKRLGELLSQ